MDINNPIGIKSSEPNQSPFIINPSRFGVAGSWDLDEDFTGCTTDQCDGLWASSDTGNIDVDTTNNWIHWIGGRGTNTHIAYDLNTLLSGDVDNNAFVLRYSAIWNAVNSSATNEQRVGIGNLPQTSSHNATWDFIGSFIRYFTAASIPETIRSCGNDESSAGPTGSDTAFVKGTSTTWNFEIARKTSTTFDMIVSDQTDYSSPTINSTNITVASTVDNLKYINMLNENAGSGSDGTNSDFKTMQFADGVTVAP
tara:strand:+ start:201 stop:962 length:762 start_codon:yes stop_codon:yes gene_type:complete